MRVLRKTLVLMVLLRCGFASSVATAQACEVEKLLAADGATSDHFGYSVAVDGDVMVVGAPQSSAAEDQAGAAYVFRRVDGAWVQEQRLTASDAATGDRFGHDVAIDGGSVVVGAPGHDIAGASSGAGYVFRSIGEGWIEEKMLVPGDGAAFRTFGSSVDVSVDTFAVGSPGSLVLPDFEGAVYVFDEDEDVWTQEKLTATDGADRDQLGISVALAGNVLCAGANENDDDGNRSGSAYVFDRVAGVWGEGQNLTASDAEAFDEFGWSVALSGPRLLIGAYRDDDAGGNAGAAYAFTFDGAQWNETQKLIAGDVAGLDQFGFSLDLDGDWAVVSAWLDDDGGDAAGAVYAYEHNGALWTERDKLTAHDPGIVDEFGRSVGISGQTALIGTWLDDDLGAASGSAYVFALSGDDADGDGVLDLCDNCPGTGNPDQVDCDANGAGDACVAAGDFNADGLVWLDDYASFLDCSDGPFAPPSPTLPECADACLAAFDANGDGDVDFNDFATLQVLLGS